jgi:hypothetical protein
LKYLHITSPVKVSKERDLYYAQPVTFETYKIAKNFSQSSLDIKQCTIQFSEDREIVSSHITILDDLKESIQDLGEFTFKYPFIKEILDSAFNYSVEFDYIIFSNVDISIMPYFYSSIHKLIERGHDAVIINRRSIMDTYKQINDLPLMFAEVGDQHPGWDCFVLKRSLYPKLNFGKGVIGAVSSGRIIYYNLKFHAENLIELTNSHLTFHLGFSPTATRQYSDSNWIKANLHNDDELKKILNEMFGSANGKEKKWINQRLENLDIRRKKYFKGLLGEKRFLGYWRIKKIFKLFWNNHMI